LPPYRFWRVPSRSGFILHGFFAAPILMDYGIVDAHDVTCFSAGGFEEGYLQDNFYKCRIHVVQDSDELGMLSLTPRSVALAKPVVRRRTLQRSRRPAANVSRFGSAGEHAAICRPLGHIRSAIGDRHEQHTIINFAPHQKITQPCGEIAAVSGGA
jgi:hypothetical protein